MLNGVVTCKGYRKEYDKQGYRGRFENGIKGIGDIAGPGMLAIEFQFDEGRPAYVLTSALTPPCTP